MLIVEEIPPVLTTIWPIVGAIGAIIIITGLIKWFHLYKQELILIGITIIILTIIQWWRDIVLTTVVTSLTLILWQTFQVVNFIWLYPMLRVNEASWWYLSIQKVLKFFYIKIIGLRLRIIKQ